MPLPEDVATRGRFSRDSRSLAERGLSEIGRLVLGSVSHKVLHHAKCSCLTVK